MELCPDFCQVDPPLLDSVVLPLLANPALSANMLFKTVQIPDWCKRVRFTMGQVTSAATTTLLVGFAEGDTRKRTNISINPNPMPNSLINPNDQWRETNGAGVIYLAAIAPNACWACVEFGK